MTRDGRFWIQLCRKRSPPTSARSWSFLEPCFVLMPGSKCQHFGQLTKNNKANWTQFLRQFARKLMLARKLMQMCKSCIPTDKSASWHFSKFHKLLHIVEDIVRFGAPINYSAERPESLFLIPAAKQPGRRSQNFHDGSSYGRQAAQRLSALFMIATVYNKIFDSNPNK
jgi:hypothetical protein